MTRAVTRAVTLRVSRGTSPQKKLLLQQLLVLELPAWPSPFGKSTMFHEAFDAVTRAVTLRVSRGTPSPEKVTAAAAARFGIARGV